MDASGDSPSQPRAPFALQRLIVLAVLFSVEIVAITLWLDNATLSGRSGLVGFVGTWGSWILRGATGFAAIFSTFAWLRNRAPLAAALFEAGRSHIAWPLLSAHFALIGLFGVLSKFLYGTTPSDAVAALWLASGLGAIALGAAAFIHPVFWLRMVRTTGYLWLWTLLAVLFACIAGNSQRALWPWATDLTFRMSRILLTPFVSGVVADPARATLGTPRFTVEIAPECSGLEGVGLILAFGLTWLVLFRRECRFPQALFLLPAGAALIFCLNSVRIAALILIGNAGAERIAESGFHSQAGWIIFNLMALGFSVAARKTPWVSKVAAKSAPPAIAVENPPAAWLVPFVAILAAGMISRAMTGDFEWTYPLRLFAAAAVLFHFRRKYATLDWRIDWLAPAAGVAVFALWIALDHFTSPVPESMPATLAAATPAARFLWLAARVLAGVVTVPIAEELAFRGFLYRRILSPDFESVSTRRFSWVALAVSSVLFGFLHGHQWLAGTAAGALYALVLLRRGRIGDAIAAHATTNALIAIRVLAFHQWHLW